MTVAEAVDDRTTWLLGVIGDNPPKTSPEDAAAAITGDDPIGLLHWLAGQLTGFELIAQTQADDNVSRVRVSCPNGRSWDLAITVEEDEPHRISWVQLDRALLEGMEVRMAGPADDAGIAEVCRNTEIVLRDCAVTIDPGRRYFDAVRLMEQATVLVATHDERIVAVHTGVSYPITYGGQRQDMSQILHSRVLKDYAGLGLWSVMNRRLVNATNAMRQEILRTGGTFRNGCAYFAVDNEAARRLNGAQSTWSFQPQRAVLCCSALADAGAVEHRVADPADAAQIVALLNEAHEGEELFLPYTQESLASRLSRADDVYSWSDLLLSDNAVVGVWDAGRIHTRRPLDGVGEVRTSVRGLVLDHGFRAGAEAELEALLRVAAARSQANGMTHLSVFTSDASRDSALLRELAEGIELYELSTPYTPEPEGAGARGLYVDQIYF